MPYKDPERKRAYDAVRYRERKPEIIARVLLWQKQEAEKHRKKGRRWVARHRLRVRAEAYAKYLRHKQDNPEAYWAAVRRARQRRKERRQALVGRFTRAEWRALCAASDHRCLRCLTRHPAGGLVRDHVIPVVAHGPGDISNMQPLCRSCSSIKGTQVLDFRYGAALSPAA